MVYDSRTFRIAIMLLFGLAAVLVFDAYTQSLWANLIMGLAGGLVLLLTIAAARFPPNISTYPVPPADFEGERLRALLDQVSVPIVSQEAGKTPIAANRAARSLFVTDDVIATSIDLYDVNSPASVMNAPVIQVLGRHYSLSLSELRTDDQFLRVAALIDVEVEVHKAEAYALRETLQVLSHEIMNSLTPVTSLAEIAEMYLADLNGDDIGAAREALNTLRRRAASLTRFIEAYRSLARLPEPDLKSVNIAYVVAEAVRDFSQAYVQDGLIFETLSGNVKGMVRLDEAQFGQALINVLTNAVEATENQHLRHITVSATQAGHKVTVAISDNGQGIPEGIRQDLFNGFSTTKVKGTGTGLNLARQIALAHGGNLQLISDGSGSPTTFAFTFPVVAGK